MKYYIIPFIMMLACSNSNTKFEQYDILAWNGMLEFKESNYKESLNYFEKAFEILPDENTSDYFYAAAAALNIGNYDKAYALLVESIEKTNTSESYFDSFVEFDNFRELSILNRVKDDFHKHKTVFLKNLEHPEIYEEIESLLEKDQNSRNNKVLKQEGRTIDSLNVLRFIQITKDYGWQRKGWLILWHQRGTFEKDNFTWSYFRPFINDGIKKGIIRKDFWANFEDAKSVNENKQQVYGLYTNQFEMFPLIDIKNVDKRRAAVGMPPLWYLSKVYGTSLPKEYKQPKAYALFE